LSAIAGENIVKYGPGEEATLRCGSLAWPPSERCHIAAVLDAVNLGPKADIALSYRGHKIHGVSPFKSDHFIA